MTVIVQVHEGVVSEGMELVEVCYYDDDNDENFFP